MSGDWSWLYLDAHGNTMAGEGLAGGGFPTQSDAESYLGESWRELRDAGGGAGTRRENHTLVYGPKIRADAAKLAGERGAKLIVCGHSHVPFVGRDRGLTVFNPGSIGPRRMHLPIVFGVLEIKAGKLSLKHIDCETGQEWLP